MRILRTGGGPLALNGGQLWLRQSDRQTTPQGVAIIHAQQVELHGKQLSAQQVSVFRLDGSDKLLSRIEATRATLGNGNWVLESARSIRPDQLPEAPQLMNLPTDLTVSRVQESFASPDTLVILGAAWVHRPAGPFRLFVDPAPAAFPGAAGLAVAGGHHDAGVRRLFDAPGSARRGCEDDRQRCGRGLRAVRGIQGRRGNRPVRRLASGAGGLGAGGIRPYAGRGTAATHRRRLRMDRVHRSRLERPMAATRISVLAAILIMMTGCFSAHRAHAQVSTLTNPNAGGIASAPISR